MKRGSQQQERRAGPRSPEDSEAAANPESTARADGAARSSKAASPPSPRRPRWIPLLAPVLLFVLVLGWYAATDWRMFRRSFETPRWGHCTERLSGTLLDQSLEIGTQYLLRHQRPEGNFDYEFDWIRKEYSSEDRQVRQAGALWALSLLHRERPSQPLAEAITRGVEFYEAHSVSANSRRGCIAYPGSPTGLTGTVAVVALAMLDAPTEVTEGRSMRGWRTRKQLDRYLEFLVSSRDPSGVWPCCYDVTSCEPHGNHSPYSDGEALLALAKAAKRLERPDLEPLVRQAASDGHRINVTEALAADRDSDTTKGYYQWSSMAFYELYTSGWDDTEIYGDWVLELADWMVDVHNPLARSRNTAYAIEGIAHGYDVAKRRGDLARQKKYRCVIDTVLEQLTSWQVGSPLANGFISSHPTDDPLALGGVQNEPRDAKLRIDVTQHQMHAVLLTRRFLYPR